MSTFKKYMSIIQEKNINEGIIGNVVDKLFIGGQKRFETIIKPKLKEKKEATFYLNELCNYDGLRDKMFDLDYAKEKIISKKGSDWENYSFPTLKMDSYIRSNFIKLFIGKDFNKIRKLYDVKITYNDRDIQAYEKSIKELHDKTPGKERDIKILNQNN